LKEQNYEQNALSKKHKSMYYTVYYEGYIFYQIYSFTLYVLYIFFGEIKLLRIMAKCTYTIINYELMLNQFLLTKSGSDDSCMYQREKGTLQM